MDSGKDVPKVEFYASRNANVVSQHQLVGFHEEWSSTKLSLDQKEPFKGMVHLPPVPSVEIRFENVSFDVKSRFDIRRPSCPRRGGGGDDKKPSKKTRLLNNVCCSFRSGQLIALMGSSGSGKTTLLNLIAQRQQRGEITGSILINGHRMSESFKKMTSYMPQQDVMWPLLTVQEQIEFQAKFRLPRDMTPEELEKRVTAVMDKLMLQNCADTRIGGGGVQDISSESVSGGERKRASVGSELVTNPSVLLLDEPISGLDSLTAGHVVRMLRALADEGRLVICTIHQPSLEVFQMFDTLLLMAKPANDTGGNMAYFGSLAGAEKFFDESCGIPVPPRMNPAVHYIEMITPVTETQKDGRRITINQQRILSIVEQFDLVLRPAILHSLSKPSVNQSNGNNHRNHLQQFIMGRSNTSTGNDNSDGDYHPPRMPKRISWWREFGLLLHLHTLLLVRNPRTSAIRIAQALILSVLAGLIYLQLDFTQSGLQNRVGALFFLLNQVFMGSLMSVIFLFPVDRPIFMREHANNAYSAFSYWQAKSLIEAPFDAVLAFTYGIIAYWMIGLQVGYHYAIYLATCILTGTASASIGFVIGSGVKDQSTAMIITPIIMIPLMVFGGFFIQAGSIPVFLDWIKYLSPYYYAFPILVNNELSGLNFTCSNTTITTGGLCPFPTGEAYLKYVGFASVNYIFNFGMLGVLCFGYRLLSMIIFLLAAQSKS